jgi:hypothetical protein
MGPEFKVFARLAGMALILVAFVASCYLENFLDVRRPRDIQPQSGFIYLHPDKHPEYYISAIDVNESRLLWIMPIAGLLIMAWFSSPRKSPVEKSLSPIAIITS